MKWHWFYYAAALWLLAGAMLPNTLYSPFYADAVINRLIARLDPVAMLLLVGTLFSAIWLSYITPLLSKTQMYLAWCILLYGAVIIIFPLFGHYPLISVTRCSLLLLSLVLGLAASRISNGSVLSLSAIATAGVAQGVYIITGFLNGKHVWWSHHIARAGGTFDWPSAAYATMLLCLPVSLGLLFIVHDSRLKLAWGASSLIIAVALLLTLSRGGLFSAGIAVGTLIYYGVRNYRTTFFVTILIVFLLFVGMAIRSSITGTAYDLSYRLGLYQNGWQLFMKQPLIGVGIDQITLTVHEKTRIAHFVTADNLFIQWLCELGVFGGILLILFMGTIWNVARRSPNNLVVISAACSLLGLFIAGILDVPFGRVERPAETTLFAALLGILLSKHDLDVKYSVSE